MSQLLPARWFACATAVAALSAWGQTATSPVAPASSPPVTQAATPRPVLEGYQPFTDEKPLPWKEVNDTVGKIGGWRAYAREAAETAPSPGGQAPAAGAVTQPHGTHHAPEAPKK